MNPIALKEVIQIEQKRQNELVVKILDAKIEFWQGRKEDPHGISNTVIVSMREIRDAVKKIDN